MKVGQRVPFTGNRGDPIEIRQIRASTLAVHHGKKLGKKFGTIRLDGGVWIVRRQ